MNLELMSILESIENTTCLRNAADATAMGAAEDVCAGEVEEPTSEIDRARRTAELESPTRPTQQNCMPKMERVEQIPIKAFSLAWGCRTSMYTRNCCATYKTPADKARMKTQAGSTHCQAV